jgi:integrase
MGNMGDIKSTQNAPKNAPSSLMPKIAANDRAVKAAKYQGRGLNTEFTILDVPGLVLLVATPRQDGRSSRTWAFRYSITVEGARRKRKVRLGRYPAVPLREAMMRAMALRELVDQGVDVVAAELAATQRQQTETLTFEMLLAEYISEQRAAEIPIASLDEVERTLLKDAVPALGHMHPNSIADIDIESCVDVVAKRGSPAMARRLLTHLRTVFNYATLRSPSLKHKYRLTSNPAALVGRGSSRGQPGKFGQDRPRERVLTDQEIVMFLDALNSSQCDPATKAILLILLHTGQRVKEVRLMGVRELRLEGDEPEWEIQSTRTKNQLAHILPLPSPVVEVIRPHIADRTTGHALLTENGRVVGKWTVGQAVDRLLKSGRLEIPQFAPHDLRRTVETGLARLNVPKEIRDRVLNHKDVSVSGRHYNKYDYRPQKRDALERWAGHLHGLKS